MTRRARCNVVRNWLASVDTIYENRSIYKSIFICPSEYLEEYKSSLQRRDYPVSTMVDIQSFIEDRTRILLFDEVDIDLFDVILGRTCEQQMMRKIDTVVVASEGDPSCFDPYLNHPELSSVQKYFVG